MFSLFSPPSLFFLFSALTLFYSRHLSAQTPRSRTRRRRVPFPRRSRQPTRSRCMPIPPMTMPIPMSPSWLRLHLHHHELESLTWSCLYLPPLWPMQRGPCNHGQFLLSLRSQSLHADEPRRVCMLLIYISSLSAARWTSVI